MAGGQILALCINLSSIVPSQPENCEGDRLREGNVGERGEASGNSSKCRRNEILKI